MSYKKAKEVLPQELIMAIQEYIDGEYLYIPRKEDNKKDWGSNTTTKKELRLRDRGIYNSYIQGNSMYELAEQYYLSIKSIQRIVLKEKNQCIK